MRLFRRGFDSDKCTGGLYDRRSNYSHVLLNSGRPDASVKKERSSNACQLSFSSIFASLRIWPERGSAWDFDVVACKERNGE